MAWDGATAVGEADGGAAVTADGKESEEERSDSANVRRTT